jgi:hypothetical protein
MNVKFLLLSKIYIQRMYDQKRGNRPPTEWGSDFHKNTIRHSPAVSCQLCCFRDCIFFHYRGVDIISNATTPSFYAHVRGGGWQRVSTKYTQQIKNFAIFCNATLFKNWKAKELGIDKFRFCVEPYSSFQLTPWSTALLANLTVSQPIKNFPNFWNSKIYTVFTTAH